MKITRIFFVAAIAFAFIVGCSGNLGKFKKKSGEDNAATVQEFKNNLVDYDVYHCPWITVLDPKNDDKTIEVIGAKCRSVDHKAIAPKFANENQIPVLNEIVGPEDQLYGYILIWNGRLASAGAMLVAENTMRVYTRYANTGRL